MAYLACCLLQPWTSSQEAPSTVCSFLTNIYLIKKIPYRFSYRQSEWRHTLNDFPFPHNSILHQLDKKYKHKQFPKRPYESPCEITNREFYFNPPNSGQAEWRGDIKLHHKIVFKRREKHPCYSAFVSPIFSLTFISEKPYYRHLDLIGKFEHAALIHSFLTLGTLICLNML